MLVEADTGVLCLDVTAAEPADPAFIICVNVDFICVALLFFGLLLLVVGMAGNERGVCEVQTTITISYMSSDIVLWRRLDLTPVLFRVTFVNIFIFSVRQHTLLST